MAVETRAEIRLLNRDEAELVAHTRRANITGLDDRRLREIISLLRERRDRARSIARQQRREVRGKAATARPASDNSGSKMKARLLAGAIQRANREMGRREERDARNTLVANARRALALKQASDTPHHPGNDASANEGMHSTPSRKTQKIGSAMEAGRVSQFVKDAQARKDSRNADN